MPTIATKPNECLSDLLISMTQTADFQLNNIQFTDSAAVQQKKVF